MNMMAKQITGLMLVLTLSSTAVRAQLSPGDLSNLHSHLEGISNCTQCHVLGNKVSNEKCMVCHLEIQKRISLGKGYHASSEVKGKQCIVCHSEHNGKNFQLIRLDTASFNHNLTGYTLSLPHRKQNCKDCHSSVHIDDQKLKSRKNTYLGLATNCLSCHQDYHRKTLSSECMNCHNPDAFKPADKFSHANSRFRLVGKHIQVGCVKCHKVTATDGKKFQEFSGIQFGSCANCHKDPHQNKFGPDCKQCHREDSFKDVRVKGGKSFDHNKTGFRLDGKHQYVECNTCHKTKFTDPLKHDRCTDCHPDYHNGQFVKNGLLSDCSECHSVKGFTLFTFTIEQHNQTKFILQGAHEATPCSECHKKQPKWNFRGIGSACTDCHKDIHQSFIQGKYYPEGNCKICHTESRWGNVSFDHSKTEFSLTGAHTNLDCRTCHFKKDSEGVPRQKFSGLAKSCTNCHIDKHFKQF
jgi:hypothetical protein